MLSFSKLIAKQSRVARQLVQTTSRQIYSLDYFGIPYFQRQMAEIQDKQDYNQIKSGIVEAINANQKPNLEDAKSFLYLAKTEEDLDIVANVAKYFKDEYRFGSPLVRLAVSTKMTDKALKLFNSGDDDNLILTSHTATLMLMNSFLAEKRYDDVLKVFNRFFDKTMKRRKEQIERGEEQSGKLMANISNNISLTKAETLLRMNNAEALKEAKSTVELYEKNKITFPLKAYTMFFLLAKKQNDIEFCTQLAAKQKPNTLLGDSIIVISLSDIDKLDEALDYAEKTITELDRPKYIFVDALNALKAAAERSTNADSKKKVAEFADKCRTNRKVFRIDMYSYCTETVHIRSEPRINTETRNAGNRGRYNENYNENNNNDRRQRFSPRDRDFSPRDRDFSPRDRDFSPRDRNSSFGDQNSSSGERNFRQQSNQGYNNRNRFNNQSNRQRQQHEPRDDQSSN